MADHPTQIPNRTARKSRAILAVLLLLPLGGLAYSHASAAVPLGSLPVIEELVVSGEAADEFRDICWDGQRLWGVGFVPDDKSTLNPVDMLTHEIGPGPVLSRPVVKMACNASNFFGWMVYSEIVWAFDRQGGAAAHHILPPAFWLEDMAWDDATPGGPYLWLKSNRKVYQARLTDPLTIVRSIDLAPLAGGGTVYGSLAMDGQHLWIVAVVEGGSTRLLKINPADGTPVQLYSIPGGQNYWELQLAADGQSPGGPFLYLMTRSFSPNSRLIYKLSTIEQDWQLSYLPFVHSRFSPTPTPFSYPWP